MFLKEEKVKRQFERPNRWDPDKTVSYTRTSTLYYFECDECGVEFTRPKNGKKAHSGPIHFCQNCNTPEHRQKLSVQSRLKKSEIRGTKFDRGYKEVWVGDDYPYRDTRWVREHIKVMEEHIKSGIPDGHVVHHIDGSKTNNDISNLLLCTVTEHNQCHAKIERLVFELYKKGLVGFDKTTMEYYYKG